MRFRRITRYASAMAQSVLVASFMLGQTPPAAAKDGYAVVPMQTIYPGETISVSQVEEVKVTNPNLAGGYASSVDQVVGMVTKRTLLQGRTIPLSGLREAYAIKRGSSVRLTFALGNMLISASGTPLTDAGVGDVIKVRNIDSGAIVSGTVMADGTVQVMAK